MGFMCDQPNPLEDHGSTVLKIGKFLKKQLTNENMESIVEQATFKNMEEKPRANYDIEIHSLGRAENKIFSEKLIIK